MATLTAIFTAQDKISSTLAKTASQGEKTSSALQKLGKLGSAAFKTVLAGVAAVTTAIIGLGKKALSVGLQFETSMSQVMATMGINTATAEGQAAYETLASAAKEMGATTAYSASEAADALNYLALAGYDANQAAEALPNVLYLAGAGAMDLAYASDLLTDSMAALQLEPTQENLTRFADQMAKTASTTNTSVSQLGEAILTVGAVGANLAGGTTELNTALGVLANVGIKGSEGGTHLRNVLLRLQAPTDKAAAALKKLGVEVYDSQGNMRDMNSIFGDMKTAMQGMSQSEIDSIMATIFNKTDIAAANALLAASGDEWERIFSIIDDSAGACQQMYETMMDNLNGDLKEFQSASEALGIAVYMAMNGTLRDLVQTGTGYVNRLLDAFNAGGFSGLVSELGSVLADAATLIASYVPKLVQLGTEVILSFADSISANSDAIATAAVQAGLALVSAVIQVAPKLISTFVTMIGSVAKALVGAIPKLFNMIPDKLFDALGINRSKAAAAVSQFTRSLRTGIKKLFSGDLKSTFSNITKLASKTFSGLGQKIGNWFGDVKGWAVDKWDSFTTAWNNGEAGVWLVDQFKGLGNKIGTAFGDVKSWAAEKWQGVRDTLSKSKLGQTILGVFDSIGSAVSGVIGKIGTWASNAITNLKNLDWSAVWSGITTTVGTLWSNLTHVASAAFALLKGWFNSVDWSAVWNTVKNTAASLWGKLVSAASTAVGLVKTWFASIDWGAIWNTVKNTATTLWGKLTSAVSTAVGLVKTWFASLDWSSIWNGITRTAGTLWSKLVQVASLASGLLLNFFSTKFSGIGEKFGEWFGKIQTALEPLQPVFEAIGTAFSNSFSTLQESFGSVVETFQGLGDKFAPILENLAPAIQNIGIALGVLLGIAATSIAGVVNGLINALGPVLSAIASAFGVIVDLIGAVVALIAGDFSGAWEHVKSAFSGVGDVLSNLAQAIGNFFSGLWSAISGIASAVWGAFSGIGSSIKGFFDNIVNGIIDGVNWCIEKINGMTGAISGLWEWAGIPEIPEIPTIPPIGVEVQVEPEMNVGAGRADLLADKVNSNVENAVNNAAPPDLSGYSSKVNEAIGTLMNSVDVGDTGVDLSSTGSAAVETLGTGIQTGGATVQSQVDTVMNNLFNSPTTTDLSSTGTDAMTTLGTGVETGGATVQAQVDAVMNGLFANTETTDLTATGTQTMTTFGAGITSGQGQVTAAMQTVDTAAQQIAASLQLNTEGNNATGTFATGITSGQSKAVTAATGVCNAVRSTFNGLNLSAAGRQIMSSLNSGLNSMRGTLLATASSIASAIRSKIQSAMNVGKGSVKGYASGTTNADNVALVGERGPELVAGIGGATVFPHQETAQILNALARPISVDATPFSYAPPEQAVRGETTRRIVIELSGIGEIEVTGMSREEAATLLSEKIKPELRRILEEEIYEGGDASYVY